MHRIAPVFRRLARPCALGPWQAIHLNGIEPESDVTDLGLLSLPSSPKEGSAPSPKPTCRGENERLGRSLGESMPLSSKVLWAGLFAVAFSGVLWFIRLGRNKK